MSNSDTARPGLRLRRITDTTRTLHEDRTYHLEAYPAFYKLVDRIEDAKWIEQKWGTFHYGSPEARRLRRCLFKQQIEDAEGAVADFLTYDDALHVWHLSDVVREKLDHAIAEYLNDSVSKSWTIEDVMAVAGRGP